MNNIQYRFINLVMSIIACFTLTAYADQPSTSILLHQCKTSTMKGGTKATPFYCGYIAGDALKEPLEIRLDTASNAVSIPMDCLNADNIKIIKSNVKDQWGYSADIVQGTISMGNYHPRQQKFNEAVTVPNFQFFALKNVSCAKGFKNFGGAIGVLNKEFKQSPNANYCLGSFFSIYFLDSKKNSDGYLITQGPTNYFTKILISPQTTHLATEHAYNLSAVHLPSCAGRNNVSFFKNPFSNIPTVPNFLIKINGIEVPSTVPQQSGKLAMIDTGGGMAIIADDEKNTVSNALNQTDNLVNPSLCPANIKWLGNCSCLREGITIEVSAKQYNVDYNYLSTDVRKDQTRALAVCPRFKRGGGNTYITPNAINLGYELFQQVDVGFDYKKGLIYFNQR